MAKTRTSSDPAATHARESRRLSTLLEVSQALSGTLNLKASMHRVLEVLASHHGAVRGIVSLLHLLEQGFAGRSAAFGVEQALSELLCKAGEPRLVHSCRRVLPRNTTV